VPLSNPNARGRLTGQERQQYRRGIRKATYGLAAADVRSRFGLIGGNTILNGFSLMLMATPHSCNIWLPT